MPELPEVEVVRTGLARHVQGRVVGRVEFRGARVARRHPPGPEDLAARVAGRTIATVGRRGKYLWLDLDGDALLVHLGMSGQLLVQDSSAPERAHVHARVRFVDEGPELWFVDQRTFGGFAWSTMTDEGVPTTIEHIARDPFDPAFDRARVIERIRASDRAIKRVLLDQRVISGVGNIYADEALWSARIHGNRSASELSRREVGILIDEAIAVMRAALTAGGTSFDSLYVHVNGESGYFGRSLSAYGRAGKPCPRCGTALVRESFMNRSSHFCPHCQRAPQRD